MSVNLAFRGKGLYTFVDMPGLFGWRAKDMQETADQLDLDTGCANLQPILATSPAKKSRLCQTVMETSR